MLIMMFCPKQKRQKAWNSLQNKYMENTQWRIIVVTIASMIVQAINSLSIYVDARALFAELAIISGPARAGTSGNGELWGTLLFFVLCAKFTLVSCAKMKKRTLFFWSKHTINCRIMEVVCSSEHVGIWRSPATKNCKTTNRNISLFFFFSEYVGNSEWKSQL